MSAYGPTAGGTTSTQRYTPVQTSSGQMYRNEWGAMYTSSQLGQGTATGSSLQAGPQSMLGGGNQLASMSEANRLRAQAQNLQRASEEQAQAMSLEALLYNSKIINLNTDREKQELADAYYSTKSTAKAAMSGSGVSVHSGSFMSVQNANLDMYIRSLKVSDQNETVKLQKQAMAFNAAQVKLI